MNTPPTMAPPSLLCLPILFLLLVPFSAADDGAIMAKLAASLTPTPASWTGTNFCTWSGILCDDDNAHVTSINLTSNSLSGTLPSDLNSLSQLTTLSLQSNLFSGPLPSLSNLSNLQTLFLDNNSFSSVPSAAFSGLSRLQDLSLSFNKLLNPWPFPADLTDSTGLVTLHAENCNLAGPIPDIFDSFPKLKDLRLSDNQLTGVVPPSLSALPNLVNLTFYGNYFCSDRQGGACDAQVTALIAVAGAFGYPMTLVASWKGNDSCDHWPFVNCDSSGNVNSVNLGKQRLSGSISPAFADLKYLQRLYLNDNNLTGTIPDELTTLTDLRILDVSNNNVGGQVPEFGAGVEVKYNGNSLIDADERSYTLAARVVCWVIIVIVFGFVFFFMYQCYRWEIDEELARIKNPKFMGQRVFGIEVIQQVTNDFSDDNILGQGGFGVVYKGELHDGTKIAVKRMGVSAMGTKGMSDIQAEIAVLGKVRHRHLVALLGYCITENERILVYEYMPQGTLVQHLFEWWELGYRPLTWKQRVTIALDVARGVEYLHSLAPLSIIHRDLKPTNILLGENMRAKVADFGLVKNVPDGKSCMWTRVVGTFGYLAPEYGATGRVTTKVDVYAFGVVLMELITGRRAVDETLPEERLHLVTWFHGILFNNEDIREAIDDELSSDDESYESILRVAELAGHCSAQVPYQRPDIGHVVNVLSPLVEQWTPSRLDEEEQICSPSSSSSSSSYALAGQMQQERMKTASLRFM